MAEMLMGEKRQKLHLTQLSKKMRGMCIIFPQRKLKSGCVMQVTHAARLSSCAVGSSVDICQYEAPTLCHDQLLLVAWCGLSTGHINEVNEIIDRVSLSFLSPLAILLCLLRRVWVAPSLSCGLLPKIRDRCKAANVHPCALRTPSVRGTHSRILHELLATMLMKRSMCPFTFLCDVLQTLLDGHRGEWSGAVRWISF